MFRQSRINRATYWLGLVVIFIFLFAIRTTPGHRFPGEVLFSLICIPRLRDLGWSAWWVAPVFLVEIIVALSAGMVGLTYFVFVLFALLVLLGVLSGDPAPNRFGEPPPRGISFRILTGAR